MITITTALVFGLVYWLRGGQGPFNDFTGSQVWKIVYGFLLASPVLVLGGNWAVFIAVGAASFALVTLGHGTFMDMGRGQPNNDDPEEHISIILRRFGIGPENPLHDRLGMALSGASYGLPLFAYLWASNVSPEASLGLLGALGAAKALAYETSWFLWERKVRLGAVDPVSMAEFLAGAAQGAVISLFLL